MFMCCLDTEVSVDVPIWWMLKGTLQDFFLPGPYFSHLLGSTVLPVTKQLQSIQY